MTRLSLVFCCVSPNTRPDRQPRSGCLSVWSHRSRCGLQRRLNGADSSPSHYLIASPARFFIQQPADWYTTATAHNCGICTTGLTQPVSSVQPRALATHTLRLFVAWLSASADDLSRCPVALPLNTILVGRLPTVVSEGVTRSLTKFSKSCRAS